MSFFGLKKVLRLQVVWTKFVTMNELDLVK